METDKIFLILRIKENYNIACRCINSILRQSVDNYGLYCVVYDEETADRLKETYPDIKFALASGDKEFKNTVNSLVAEITGKYCMLVDSDSILAINAIERLLQYDDELVVFNLSKAKPNGKFATFYKAGAFEGVTEFMKNNQSVWALAFKTDLLKNNKIELKGLGYENQALFLLMCLSFAKSIAFCKDVFLYKWSISKKKEISDIFYYKNRDDIKRAIRKISRKGDNLARAQVVKIFLFEAIKESYDRPFLRRMKKILTLVKLIWF